MPNPPFELMGWLGPEVAEPEFARLSSNFIPFQIYGSAEAPVRTSPGTPIWEFAKRVNGGQHLPTWRQESGDCVAMGCAQAGQYMSVFEIAIRGQEEMFKYWYPPFIYGASRVQVGGGRLRGPGSTGAWGATAMMKMVSFSMMTLMYQFILRDWLINGVPILVLPGQCSSMPRIIL